MMHIPEAAKSEVSQRGAERPSATKSSDRRRAAPKKPSRAVCCLIVARPGRWYKNVLILAGVVAAWWLQPTAYLQTNWLLVILGLLAACLLASSNYVLNEILDAVGDSHHPIKHRRVIANDQLSLAVAYTEWLVLGAAGLLLASRINGAFFAAASALLLSGLVYNTPPVRLKDIAYLDFLSEAINSPIRFLMGWFLICPDKMPAISLILSFWMAGAFVMAWKRQRELVSLPDKQTAIAYRKSFQHYHVARLQTIKYVCGAITMVLLGVFVLEMVPR